MVIFHSYVSLPEGKSRIFSGKLQRKKNYSQEMPVQGEVAFDPFAMMDEQPDSKFTTAPWWQHGWRKTGVHGDLILMLSDVTLW